MLYLSAKLEKFSVRNHLLVENNSLLKARALSFRTLTPVGKMGDTMTVVFGDNLPICSILCINSSKALSTMYIIKFTTPYALQSINANVVSIFVFDIVVSMLVFDIDVFALVFNIFVSIILISLSLYSYLISLSINLHLTPLPHIFISISLFYITSC